MRMKPLKQWICDTCGEIIEKPEDGYVQFHRNADLVIDDFIIVHHLSASPFKQNNKQGCYRFSSDCDLASFLGDNGLVRLHALIDPGPYHSPEYREYVADIRKWSELYRRLHLPYYEEARLYWDRAMSDGFFGGANEVFIYLPDNLKAMIEYYEKEDCQRNS